MKLAVPLFAVGMVLLVVQPQRRRAPLPPSTLSPPTVPIAAVTVAPPAAREPTVEPTVGDLPRDTSPQETPKPVPPAPVSQRPPSSRGLEAELALIAAAQAAIQRADYAEALARLAEHERSFPAGVLAEERTAARVVALCGAGEHDAAQALAGGFLARHPTSPLAPRVRGACGSD